MGVRGKGKQAVNFEEINQAIYYEVDGKCPLCRGELYALHLLNLLTGGPALGHSEDKKKLFLRVIN